MTEDDARAWAIERFGPDKVERLQAYVDLLLANAEQQNLISRGTLPAIWSRHIVDSAQLLALAPPAGTWIDIGSGAGLPGIVVAILGAHHVILVEPRKLRVAFLEQVAATLGLQDRTSIFSGKMESLQLSLPAQIVSARAVASLPSLLATAAHATDKSTIWVLPKGRTAESDVADARKSWHGIFHVEPSITDPESGIVVAQGVYRR